MHYATSVMQAPKYAQPGGKARELEIVLELKSIADVGLVGFPNVGKSTFLSSVSNARPKIANYHFTTLSPNLGVVDLGDSGFIIADIPGLIEGASAGAGLGHEFLRHIERCRILIHLVDGAGTEGRDPVQDIKAINAELSEYNNILNNRIHVIAVNKMDLIYDEDERKNIISKISDAFPGVRIFPVSAATGEGIKPLLYYVKQILDENTDESHVFESEVNPDNLFVDEILPFYVTKENETTYSIEGPRIEKMLGYTNLESEKGFMFFQTFLKENGIIDQLKELGISEGDTVRVYAHEFEYLEG